MASCPGRYQLTVGVRHQERSMSINGRGEMASKVSRGRPEGGFLGLLRAAALIAVLAGAVGSVGLMLHAGRRNDSRILLVLFALWVLSPFMALVLANVVSKRWSVLTRATLYSAMLVLTLGSLAIYGDVALGPPRAQTAFVFVVVPPASWLLIAIVVPLAAQISGRRARRGDGASPGVAADAYARAAERQALGRSAYGKQADAYRPFSPRLRKEGRRGRFSMDSDRRRVRSQRRARFQYRA